MAKQNWKISIVLQQLGEILTIQVLIPEAAMIKSFLLPALSIKKNGIAQQMNLKVRSVAPRILDRSCDRPTAVKRVSA